MKLIRFRIQNYKSVQDSGYCWLASDLTVLAGKNESGKTAVLEALRDFDPAVSISTDAHPIDQKGLPLLECQFALETTELEELFEAYSPALRNALVPKLRRVVTLFRDHDGGYRFDEVVSEVVERVDADVAEKALAAERKRAARLAVEAAQRAAEAEESEDHLDGEEEEEEDEVPVEEEEGEAEAEAKPLLQAVVDLLPRFVFFSSFEDFLPYEITFTRAKNNRAIQDFAKVAGLNLAEIAKIDDLTSGDVLSETGVFVSPAFG